MKKRISVIGLGYVGLCTALTLADKGYKVIAIDSNSEKITKLNKGIPYFFEPGLKEKLRLNLQKSNIQFLHDRIPTAILKTDLTFVTVGTPNKFDGNIDLQYIKSVSHDLGKALYKKTAYHLIVIKSTVTPETTQNLVKPILEQESKKKCGLDFGLCVNPEFLRQGSAFKDALHSDRIIIGEYNKKSGDILENFYHNFYDKNISPIVRTNLSTAEIIKYASNSLLATKISFINMIANICEKIPNADVKTVAAAVGLDKRINPSFLNAGIGYGGSCFPKDVKALIAYSKKIGYYPQLLESVNNTNEAQPLKVVERCKGLLENQKEKLIAILGLAFKPETDDMRNSQVIPIIDKLTRIGAQVIVYDPVAIPVAKTIFKDKIQYAASAIECLANADCCILATEWDEFKKLKPKDFIRHMKKPILIDGRRIYNPQEFNKKMTFFAIGLGCQEQQLDR